MFFKKKNDTGTLKPQPPKPVILTQEELLQAAGLPINPIEAIGKNYRAKDRPSSAPRFGSFGIVFGTVLSIEFKDGMIKICGTGDMGRGITASHYQYSQRRQWEHYQSQIGYPSQVDQIVFTLL